jgi:hypothetical protein
MGNITTDQIKVLIIGILSVVIIIVVFIIGGYVYTLRKKKQMANMATNINPN